MNKYFYYERSPYKSNYFLIRLHHENLPIGGTLGSCNVLMARICNLSYASYLRMCRDKFNAQIIGKGTIYGMAYFPVEKESKVKELVKILNERTEKILKNIT